MKRKHGESSKSPGSSPKKKKHKSPGSSSKKRKHTQSPGTSSKKMEMQKLDARPSKQFHRELFPDQVAELDEKEADYQGLTPVQALVMETLSPGKRVLEDIACRKYARDENKLIYKATKSLPDHAGTNEIYACLIQDKCVSESSLLTQHTRQSLRDKFKSIRKKVAAKRKDNL
ncbi:uncharacterized protein LOC114538120 [Dendronephthya gigantea]|uniref:uncharacterized protein LOC114538120 n=1 Tax=Dendronephthya gigantea TaxID=151771 RepID=UPI00106BDD7D|nr:uncharacterized protein LOC114538120 [Dendronephthya gigantea]